MLGQFIDAKGRAINHPINKRAIALPLARLSKAKFAMLVAGGMNKAPVIAAALRGRIGNILVSDEKTASEALELAERGVLTMFLGIDVGNLRRQGDHRRRTRP